MTNLAAKIICIVNFCLQTVKLPLSLPLDDSYTRFHTTDDYPISKYLQHPVYFEVELKGTTNPDMSVELENCWASLYDNRTSQPRWNLIING